MFILDNCERATQLHSFQVLSEKEKETCKAISKYLKEWKDNFSSYPTVSSERNLVRVEEKFGRWLEKEERRENKPVVPKRVDWDSLGEQTDQWLVGMRNIRGWLKWV